MIGVLGGGQLGRMLGLAGVELGQELAFLDPSAESPARHVGTLHVAPYDDAEALALLARACEVVTYEFESVPVASVRALEAHGATVFPPAKALEVGQDRLAEKSFFVQLGIETAPFAAVHGEDELLDAVDRLGLPAVLKTRRFGYDGKGQFVVRAREDVPVAWRAVRGVPCILERFVPFDRELSILTVRGRNGEAATYPLVENHHAGGILRVSHAPAPEVSARVQAKAAAYAESIARELGYVGVLALELFAVGGELLANEMAPRVHNSGHWTIEGAETSQFENHLRAILGWPLGSTACLGASAMVNVIGGMPRVTDLLAIEGVHAHVYGKEPAPGRKLGHVTVRGASRDAIADRLEQVRAIVAASAA